MNYLIFILFLIISCSPTKSESINDCGNECSIDIYAVFQHFNELELDSAGYYHFNYPDNIQQHPSDYGTVYYTTTEPMTRVGWYSPDSFYYEMFGEVYGEPIINYSTYSGDDADSQQLFYVNHTLIGDTLDIYGYYYNYNLVIDSIKVIIDD